MRHVPVALVLSMFVGLAGAPSVSADPRMETNHNFCHFIMDGVNTDNEVFVAGCDSMISTAEVPKPAEGAIACENALARGYGERIVVVPQAALKLPPGTTLTFSSADSEAMCTMVESNGRAYRSKVWRSTINVEATGRPGQVRVRYTLLCVNGRP